MKTRALALIISLIHLPILLNSVLTDRLYPCASGARIYEKSFIFFFIHFKNERLLCFRHISENRMESNDQESIQLSHTSHQRHQRERNTKRNHWTLMETSLAESQTDSYFPIKWPNGYPKQKDVSDTHIQRRTITKINHDRRTALERSVKSISLGWQGGGGRA